ncbi:MAG: recombinase zinc beta ribbon domain-containing protein [Solirubrobacteraceae bacterium]
MHYPKGTLTCAECGSRMIFGRHRGKTGAVYDYFSCVNRRARNGGTCDSGHYRAEQIEVEVAALYFGLGLTRGQIAKVRREITEHAEEHTTTIQRAAERHRRLLKKLEDEQTKLLEASDVISKNVLRRQTERIEAEEKSIHQLLGHADVQLADIRETLEDALALVAKPIETYLDAGDFGRRLLNQVFFSEIRVGEHGEVTEATIVPAYARIIAPRLLRRRSHENEAAIVPKAAQGRRNPGPLSLGPGLTETRMARPERFELPTFGSVGAIGGVVGCRLVTGFGCVASGLPVG